MRHIVRARWLGAGVAVSGGALLALILIYGMGCSGVASTLMGGEAAAFASASRTEEKAHALEDRAERRAMLLEAYDSYVAVVESDPSGKFANRARFAAASIQNELVVPGGANYDDAVALLNEIVATEPAGYMASQARSLISAVRKNRVTIQQSRAIFDNTAPDADAGRKLRALESLHEVARSYESLRDYDTAITTYRDLIERASEWSQEPGDDLYKKAAQAQFQIGNIYFYGYHNYADGWPEFGNVIRNYPESFEKDQAETLLIRTKESLDAILLDQNYIRSKRRSKADAFIKSGRTVLPTEIYGVYGEQVAQYYLNIAQTWATDPLRNLPAAIKNYRLLVDELWSEMFVASDGMFQIGVLYQDNGEYNKAISAYGELFDRFPQSFLRGRAVYNRAVCYETIREFEIAYREYRAAVSLGQDTAFYRGAEQKVRQLAIDEDGDGFKFYEEQQHGTSDKDPESYPGDRKSVV